MFLPSHPGTADALMSTAACLSSYSGATDPGTPTCLYLWPIHPDTQVPEGVSSASEAPLHSTMYPAMMRHHQHVTQPFCSTSFSPSDSSRTCRESIVSELLQQTVNGRTSAGERTTHSQPGQQVIQAPSSRYLPGFHVRL